MPSLLVPILVLAIAGSVFGFFFMAGKVPGTLPFYARRLNDPRKQIRLEAARALGESGGIKAALLLCDVLNHTDPDLRRFAVDSLVRIGDPRSLEAVGSRLSDTNPTVRRAVAAGLVAFDDPRATDLLCEALRDMDEAVVAAAASGLGKLRDPRAAEGLCRALSYSSEAATSAMDALVGLGMDAFETLCRLLPDAGNVSAERMVSVLVKINPEAAFEPLGQLMRTAKTESIAKTAIKALAKLDHPDSTAALAEYLREQGKPGREHAIHALKGNSSEPVIAALCGALSDSELPVRKAAAEVLGETADLGCVEFLIPALMDEDKAVVKLVASALGRLREPRIMRAVVEALWPGEYLLVAKQLEEALKKPIDEVMGHDELLPLLEKLGRPNAKAQEDVQVRYSIQSLLILLANDSIRAFRDLSYTVLLFKGSEFTSPTREEKLHPLALESLEFVRSQRDVRRWQSLGATLKKV